MNREEILAKSRAENRNGDEHEKGIREHAQAVSAAVGGLICMLTVASENLLFDRSTTVIWLIYTGMMFAQSLTEATRARTRRYIGFSVIFGILFVLFVALYLAEGFGW